MRKLISAAAAALALAVSAPAAAATTISFQASGFSGSGGTAPTSAVSGSFSYDYDVATSLFTLTAFNLTIGPNAYTLASDVRGVYIDSYGLIIGGRWSQNGSAVEGNTNDFAISIDGFNPMTGTNSYGIGNVSTANGFTLYYSVANNSGTFSSTTDGVTRVQNLPAALPAAVPEPATWAMMLLGFGGIGFAMRKQRKPIRQIA